MKKKKKRSERRKKLARRLLLQTCLFIMVATWPEPKRTNPTRDKPIVKSRRNILLRTRRLLTSTILESTDSVKRPRNCGTNSTNTKKKNTTSNKEFLARNTTATNYVNVSTNTWANLTKTRTKSKSLVVELVQLPQLSNDHFHYHHHRQH